jgi:hypothetical protein
MQVGYLVGLGDRHSANILMDKKSAEVIQIDLGCAFEQGKTLSTPEMVPFRLTRDIVDGMGITGVEGTMRRCCEKTIQVWRSCSPTDSNRLGTDEPVRAQKAGVESRDNVVGTRLSQCVLGLVRVLSKNARLRPTCAVWLKSRAARAPTLSDHVRFLVGCEALCVRSRRLPSPYVRAGCLHANPSSRASVPVQCREEFCCQSRCQVWCGA